MTTENCLEPLPRQRPMSRRTRVLLMLAALAILAVVAAERWHRHFTKFPEELSVELGGLTLGLPPAREGFDMTNALVSPEQILSGGPPKDGIPSITDPEHVPVSDFDLPDSARVVGVTIGDVSVAYPIPLLNWHEAVNDEVNGVPIAVTYCPLCDSVAVFDRRRGGEVLEFGISGRLYNSNVLLYDRRPDPSDESLWSQLQGRAVTGPLAGQQLETKPFDLAPWADWRSAHPQGLAVAFPDPPRRAYASNPYTDYFADPEFIMFGVQPLDDRRPRKERILGLAASGEAVAIPLTGLEAGPHTFSIAGAEVTARWDPGQWMLRVTQVPPGVKAMHTFWFAWGAMHPETTIQAPE